MKQQLLAALTLSLALACGGGASSGDGGDGSGSGGNPPVALTEHQVSPQATDPGIGLVFGGTKDESHYAYIASGVTKKNQLFLFLPGSTAVPKYYLGIVQEAARQGFHALGLTYENPTEVRVLCLNSSDPDCSLHVHESVQSGDGSSAEMPVSAADSLNNRLLKALQYLDAQYPGEGWGQYAAGGTLHWDLIRVAGHSQGGSQAAYIGKTLSVARVTCFDSPADPLISDATATTPATWVSDGVHVTPSDRYYGFTHDQDTTVKFQLAQNDWADLGLPGAPTLVDGAAAPYSGSHRLYTDVTLTNIVTITPYHDATIVDVQTPKNPDGTPLYTPVWDYVCFQ